jgi:uncharacterized protein
MPYRFPRTSPYKLNVKRGIAGLGLFAGERIPKGEFIVEYYGQKRTDKQADEKGGKYLFHVDDNVVIDGSQRDNIARYINHSCKPNCEPEIDGKRIFLYAVRTITAGEELTYNYGKEYAGDLIYPKGCKCGNH